MLLRYDHSKVAVEDVVEGDLLLGPDGGSRRAFNIVKGTERLYRIVFGKREDLVVTGNHILVLHRYTGHKNRYKGPTMAQHHENFADRFGNLPQPSSEPGAVDRPQYLTKQRPDFMSALKSVLIWMLNVQGRPRSADRIRNVINGTSGIRACESHILIDIPEGDPSKRAHTTYAWGNASRALLTGHPDHPPEFFDTREEAYAAAVRKSREIRNSGELTLDNLRVRFMDKSANGLAGAIKVDSAMPRLDLLWGPNRTALKFRVSAKTETGICGRFYGFPGLPPGSSPEIDDVHSDNSDVDTTTANELHGGRPGPGTLPSRDRS